MPRESSDMKSEEFLQHSIAQKWGGKDNTGIIHWGETLEKLCFPECSVLLVGTGWEPAQYYDWPTILEDIWNAKVSYLEVDQGYINKWKGGPYPLYEGSVTDIKSVVPKSFDVILWVQGPEHIAYEQMLPTFEAMYDKAHQGIICTCPWGSYYDYQGVMNNNPNESHIQKSMTEETFGSEFANYDILFGGVKDSSNGQILIWRKHEN